MYVLVPTNVLAMELISSPDTPKSQILISPLVFARMLDGLMSGTESALESKDITARSDLDE
jgi:hypothetical protein